MNDHLSIYLLLLNYLRVAPQKFPPWVLPVRTQADLADHLSQYLYDQA